MRQFSTVNIRKIKKDITCQPIKTSDDMWSTS